MNVSISLSKWVHRQDRTVSFKSQINCTPELYAWGVFVCKETNMETWYYEVISIDGDYANLKRTDIESDDLKLVARALLPAEIVEGSRLKYEMMSYTME